MRLNTGLILFKRHPPVENATQQTGCDGEDIIRNATNRPADLSFHAKHVIFSSNLASVKRILKVLTEYNTLFFYGRQNYI